MARKMSEQEFLERLRALRGDELVLVGTFNGTKQKTMFVDKEHGEWYTTPERVMGGARHPARRAETTASTKIAKYGSLENAEAKAREVRAATNSIKYGHENPLLNSGVREKARLTNLARFGHEHAQKSDTVKLKTAQTVMEKYGSQTEFGRRNIERARETNLEKYGKEFFLQTEKRWETNAHSPEAELKRRQTNLLIHGTEYPIATHWQSGVAAAHSEESSTKRKETCRAKFGTDFAVSSDTVRQKIKEKRDNGEINLPVKHRKSDGSQMFTEGSEPSYNRCAHFARRKNISIEEAYHILVDTPKYQSSLEKETADAFGLTFSGSKYHSTLKYKPDFELKPGLFLNVDGFMFHREAKVGKMYHFEMRKKFESIGEQILQFTDYEIFEKTDIVRSMINARIGKETKKIYARKLKPVLLTKEETRTFLLANHLKGYTTSIGYGLKDEAGEIKVLLSIKRKNLTTIKIERFCNKKHELVVGGYSRLLKHVESHLPMEVCFIETWVDLRYGKGSHLTEMGFDHIKETLGFYWSNGFANYNRLHCRANMDDRNLTEEEHAKEMRLVKIWDAGQRLFRKRLR